MNEGSLLNSFVWLSSEQSRDSGKISVLGIIETILSVAVLWLLVSWTGRYWVLLASIVLAFLVLLRSQESIAKGRDMFIAYYDRAEGLSKAETVVILVLSAASAGAMAWLLAIYWLDGQSGWILFRRSTVFAWLAINIALTITTTVGGSRSIGLVDEDISWETRTASLGVGLSETVWMMAAVAGVAAVAGAVAITGVGAVSVAAAVAVVTVGGAAVAIGIIVALGTALQVRARKAAAVQVEKEAGVLARAIERKETIVLMGAGTTVLAPGVLFGIALRTFAIRFWATLYYLRKGLPRFAENWTNLAIKTDLFTPPELIPGLPEGHILHFRGMLHSLRMSDSPKANYLFGARLMFFVPSTLYRYYLKSTAWLYFPLIWLVYVPRGIRNEDGKLKWDRAQGRSLLDIIFILLALLVLAYAVIRVFDWPAFLEAWEAIAGNELLVTPWLMLAGIDFGRLDLWYWIPTLSALFGVVVFFWSNQLQTYAKGNSEYQPPQWVLWAILKLNSAKNWLTTAWILYGIYGLVWALYYLCRLPEAASPWLAIVLGQSTCP